MTATPKIWDIVVPCSSTEMGYCPATLHYRQVEFLPSPLSHKELLPGSISILSSRRVRLKIVHHCSKTTKEACQAIERLGGKLECGRVLANRAVQIYERNMVYVIAPEDFQRTMETLLATNESAGDASNGGDPAL